MNKLGECAMWRTGCKRGPVQCRTQRTMFAQTIPSLRTPWRSSKSCSSACAFAQCGAIVLRVRAPDVHIHTHTHNLIACRARGEGWQAQAYLTRSTQARLPNDTSRRHPPRLTIEAELMGLMSQREARAKARRAGRCDIEATTCSPREGPSPRRRRLPLPALAWHRQLRMLAEV